MINPNSLGQDWPDQLRLEYQRRADSNALAKEQQAQIRARDLRAAIIQRLTTIGFSDARETLASKVDVDLTEPNADRAAVMMGTEVFEYARDYELGDSLRLRRHCPDCDQFVYSGDILGRDDLATAVATWLDHQIQDVHTCVPKNEAKKPQEPGIPAAATPDTKDTITQSIKTLIQDTIDYALDQHEQNFH